MKRTLICLIMASLIVVVAWAQEDAVAILEFATDITDVQVVDRDDFEVEIFLGIGLSPGDRLIANDSAVELRLEPNGSIVRIAPGTTFEIEALQGRQGATATRTVLERGRARFVAAQSPDRRYSYSVRTPSLVAGVRGTDFGLAAIPGAEEAFVFGGEIIVTAVESGEEVFLGTGQGIAAGDEPFLPQTWGPERIRAFEETLQFESVDPRTVPGSDPDPEPESEPTDVATPAPPEPEPEPEPGFADRLFSRLARATGLQIGSVTLDQQTYGQVVFQPRITAGDFELAFYLPITYRSNLFDPNEWYQPAGNNEWSFGTDQDWSDDPQEALTDLAIDIALKIRYLQYRDRGDPFFIKLGNMNSFTIGQGLLMRNYANDSDFPSVRRMGFNMGLDRTAWGIEAFVNDLLAPDIYGGRLYFRPAAPAIPAAVGFSAITDQAPAGTITAETALENDALRAAREADPTFVNAAVDLEIPIVRRDIFSLIGFAEAGALIPYVRSATELDGNLVSSGTKTNAMVDFESGDMRNYGWTSGIRGGLLVFDYRLAYQYYDGTFRPGFYGPSYDRLRGTLAAETITYLANTEDDRYKNTIMGVEGELGATLFGALYLGAGYLWPWEVEPSGSWKPYPEDELTVRFRLQEGVIPLGLGLGFEYRRRYLAASIGEWGGYSSDDLFDANTTLDGYVSYPLTDFISIVARVSTAAQRDAEGELIYDNEGRPKMAPTVMIQTEIGY